MVVSAGRAMIGIPAGGEQKRFPFLLPMVLNSRRNGNFSHSVVPPTSSPFPQLSFGHSATKPVLRYCLQVQQGMELEKIMSGEWRQADGLT